jgi:hypothetical protein
MKISLRSLLLVIAAGVITCSLATAQSLPKRTHGHEVSLDSAKKFIKNLKKDAMQMKLSGGLYFRDVFDKMLSQKGVVALRFYFAKTDDGNPTLVAVGVDSTGRDMTSGVIAESTYPCPPYCESASELLK